MWGSLFPVRPSFVHGRGDEYSVLFERTLEDGPICVESTSGTESRVYRAMELLGRECNDVGFEVDGDLCVVVIEVFIAL